MKLNLKMLKLKKRISSLAVVGLLFLMVANLVMVISPQSAHAQAYVTQSSSVAGNDTSLNTDPARRSFYGYDRQWFFYQDESTSNFYYNSGVVVGNDTIWKGATLLDGTAYNSIFFDGTNVECAGFNPSSPGHIYWREGLPDTDGNITWVSAPIDINFGDTNIRVWQLSVCVNTSLYPFIAFSYDNGQHTAGTCVIKGEANDGTFGSREATHGFGNLPLGDAESVLCQLSDNRVAWVIKSTGSADTPQTLADNAIAAESWSPAGGWSSCVSLNEEPSQPNCTISAVGVGATAVIAWKSNYAQQIVEATYDATINDFEEYGPHVIYAFDDGTNLLSPTLTLDSSSNILYCWITDWTSPAKVYLTAKLDLVDENGNWTIPVLYDYPGMFQGSGLYNSGTMPTTASEYSPESSFGSVSYGIYESCTFGGSYPPPFHYVEFTSSRTVTHPELGGEETVGNITQTSANISATILWGDFSLGGNMTIMIWNELTGEVDYNSPPGVAALGYTLSHTFSGLIPATTYEYAMRIVTPTRYWIGPSYPLPTFETLGNGTPRLPQAKSISASAIPGDTLTGGGVQLSMQVGVLDDGGVGCAGLAQYRLQGASDWITVSDPGVVHHTGDIFYVYADILESGKLYEWRAMLTNGMGSGYGDIKTIDTSGVFVEPTPTPTGGGNGTSVFTIPGIGNIHLSALVKTLIALGVIVVGIILIGMYIPSGAAVAVIMGWTFIGIVFFTILGFLPIWIIILGGGMMALLLLLLMTRGGGGHG